MLLFNLPGDSPEVVLEKHISVKAAAEISGYSIHKVRRLLTKGRLEAIRSGQARLLIRNNYLTSSIAWVWQGKGPHLYVG
jgi:hypothetical protein